MSGSLHVESSGTGASCVLLHGWGMHAGIWGPIVPALAARQRVHAVDLPGHGHSAAVTLPTPPTLDAYVDAVATSIPDDAGPLTVIGWSFGGQIALRWARSSPQRIARLVLVATTPKFVAAADWPHAMDVDTLVRFGDELRVAYRLTLLRFLSLQLAGAGAGHAGRTGRTGRTGRAPASDDGHAALAALRRDLFARGEPPPGALAAALAVLAETDLRDEAGSIHQPTLVVSGERDTLAWAAAGAWLAAALPQGRYQMIAGAGHLPFLSHPAEFLAALEGFYDQS